MMRKKQLFLLSVLVTCSMVLFLFISHTSSPKKVLSEQSRTTLGQVLSEKSQREFIAILNRTTERLAITGGVDFQDIVKVAKKVASHNGTVLVTMVNDAYLSFTYSWLCNTKTMNIHKSVLIITTDKISKQKLERDWPEISVVAMDMGQVSGDQTYSHVGYVKIMIKRTEMILDMLLADLEIFLFEVDCLWFGNAVPGLQAMKGYDVLVNPVATRPGIYAGGFLYLFTTDKAKELWKQVTKEMLALGDRIKKLKDATYISEGDNDQQYLSRLIVQRYGGISVKELPLDIYADGKWYDLTDAEREKSKAIIVNNNWVLGNKGKIDRAKKWKHWFIHDDMTCDMDLVKKTVH